MDFSPKLDLIKKELGLVEEKSIRNIWYEAIHQNRGDILYDLLFCSKEIYREIII